MKGSGGRSPVRGLSPARRVTVYCPVQRATLAAIAGGDLDALDRDPHAGPILAIIERSADLGNFGRYRGVFELGIGVEGSRRSLGRCPPWPERRSDAVLHRGHRHLRAHGRVAGPAGRIVGRISRRTPWEIPVIEVADVHLFGEPPAD